MYFALWALGAAASFLYGCYSKQESDEKKPSNTFRNRQIHTIPAPAKLAQPTRPYVTEFGTNLIAEQAYQSLINAGVKPAQINIGCKFPKTTVLGNTDHRIEPCEVDEFLFFNYQKYKAIFEQRTQSPIPWKLDETTTQKVHSTIEQLKNYEALKRFPHHSNEYRKRLATALFHFAQFPNHLGYLQKHSSEWRKFSSELKSMGLEDFQKKLLAEGGLGVSLWKKDDQGVTDGTTLAALRTKIGSSVAKNHLLFSIFEQAELDPYFANVDLTQQNSSIEENIQQGNDIPVYRTSAYWVGIPLQKEEKLFDLSQTSPQTPRNYEIVPLKIYYSYFLSWRGANATMHKQYDQAIEFFKRSLELNTKSHTASNSYGFALMEKGDKDLAELFFKKSISVNPLYHLAFENLGNLYWEQGKTEEALQQYYNAIRANPRWVKTFSKDKLLEKAGKILKNDPDNVTAKSILQAFQTKTSQH